MKTNSISLLAALAFSASVMASQGYSAEKNEVVVHSEFSEITYVGDTHWGPQKGGDRETITVDLAKDWEGTKVVKVGDKCEERRQKVVGHIPVTSSTGVTLQKPDIEHTVRIVTCPINDDKQ